MLRTAFLALALIPGLLAQTAPAVQTNSAKPATAINVQGTYDAARLLGYPGQAVCPVLFGADGKVYILKFSTPAQRRQARELDGKPVILTGTVTGAEEFTILCVPKPERLLVVSVRQLTAAPVSCGILLPMARHTRS
jgi:hypothetical protein